ncbi:hypothetical protein KM295_14835 [Natronomonas sp. F2-12]|jgi:hypothetical protein|uniref:Uncharacterized protein n=1 Tax=Natronomonas aquatica TaxID=2841590 RepID=A0A9R1CVP3_9EURY|nr:hypothetical protein [Natronomonas aquatica]MCQ4334730.1 hypothetical protein [Natronomonas aquatica]
MKDEERDSTGDEDSSKESSSGEGPEEVDTADVEVTKDGAVDPKEPQWQKPSIDDIPEFETGGNDPTSAGDSDPTAGKPNEARTPSTTRFEDAESEAYLAAIELCARLPDDLRLPEEAADLVPAAFEAELEQEIQAFAIAEFDNPTPHVEVLEFTDIDGDIWLKIRMGVPIETFDSLEENMIELREYALEELDALLGPVT